MRTNMTEKKYKNNGEANKTHGMSSSPEYQCWLQMRKRCTNPTDKAYARYGSRGIKVCDRWMTSFANFFNDMGVRPEGKTLDRIDVNGNYEPKNCRWASYETQANNKTNNHYITYKNVTKSASEFAKEYEIKVGTLIRRLNAGWEIEDALNFRTDRKVHQKKLIEHNGVRLSLTEWAEKLSIPKGTLKTRITRGWDLERALNYV